MYSSARQSIFLPQLGQCPWVLLLLLVFASIAPWADAASPPSPEFSNAYGMQVVRLQLDAVVVQMRSGLARSLAACLQDPSSRSNAEQSPASVGVLTSSRRFLNALDILRQEGLVKLLAEPRLVTLSGRPACFLLGGEDALMPSGDRVAFEQRHGLRLELVPTVLKNGKIRLEIFLEDGPASAHSPARLEDRARASAELKAGQALLVCCSPRDAGKGEASLAVLVTPSLVGPSSEEKPAQGSSPARLPFASGIQESSVGATTPQAERERLRRLQRRLERMEEELEDLRHELRSR